MAVTQASHRSIADAVITSIIQSEQQVALGPRSVEESVCQCYHGAAKGRKGTAAPVSWYNLGKLGGASSSCQRYLGGSKHTLHLRFPHASVAGGMSAGVEELGPAKKVTGRS